MTAEQRKEMRELCSALPMMEDRLRRAGLLATAVKLNAAVREIGYEVERIESHSEDSKSK